MISSAAKYAVRALTYLATQPAKKYTSAQSIAVKLKISGAFLSKILKRLVDAGMVESLRGPTGGLRIRESAELITVREVVEAIDGAHMFGECVLGLPGCGEDKPCPMHDAWVPARMAIEQSLSQQTIRQLAVGVESGEHRVSP